GHIRRLRCLIIWRLSLRDLIRNGWPAGKQTVELYAQYNVRDHACRATVAVCKRMNPIYAPHHVGSKVECAPIPVIVHVVAKVFHLLRNHERLHRSVATPADFNGYFYKCQPARGCHLRLPCEGEESCWVEGGKAVPSPLRLFCLLQPRFPAPLTLGATRFSPTVVSRPRTRVLGVQISRPRTRAVGIPISRRRTRVT